MAIGACISAASAQINRTQGQTPPPGPKESIQSTYVLGPDDQITIQGVEAEEFANKPVRVDADGNVNLPMIGRVHVAGLSLSECETALNQKFATYVRNPQLSVSLTELRSQPVSVVGAVNNPGVVQVQGRKTLLELLSLAGGLRQDSGYSVKITRQADYGRIPLPDAEVDPSGRFSVAELSLKQLMEAKDPATNIRIMPHDVITVPRASIVYVVGQVHKAGGFTLGENRSLSVLQALSLAEGLDPTANSSAAKILRAPKEGTQRQETPVDLKKILAGKSEDIALRPDDILFVPSNQTKRIAIRAIETAVSTASGVVIWRGAKF